MEVIFLGYNLINFTNENGQNIDGLKMYFCHESDRSSYCGFMVDQYFVDRVSDEILFRMVQNCKPMKSYYLDLIPSFGKKKSRIKSINDIKS